MNDYQQRQEARFRNAPLNAPPAPWRRRWVGPVGGLLEIGFAPNSELLLVVSAAGRGVFDCRTGERVARDDEASLDWADPVHLTAEGIGPLTGQTIRMAGIWGGGLPVVTEDGWHWKVIPLNWATDVGFLCPPGADIFRDLSFELCRKIHSGDRVRAGGFSETGNSLVIAEGSGVSLMIYHRG